MIAAMRRREFIALLSGVAAGPLGYLSGRPQSNNLDS